MKKKLLLIYIIIVYAVCMSACSPRRYDGQELIDSAAVKHTALESAHITVTDDVSGNIVQEITYRFAGDVMQYMYTGYDPETGKTYYEYNNGTELDFMTSPDESEWSFYAKGDENYYSYSRATRHYFADGKQLLNDYEAAVSGAEISDCNGGKALTLSYDLGKLSQYSSLAAYGQFRSFSERFVFDPDGLCAEYSTSFSVVDGEDCGYTVRIEKREQSQPVERVEREEREER